MIPRFKPYIDQKEYQSIFSNHPDAISDFEQGFAEKNNTKHAIAFMYGRSAIWALLKAKSIENADVILPAYTCKVVAEAVVISNNRPKFIDINPFDFNMNLEQLQEAIDHNTRAIIATHLFGHPMNIDKLTSIVSEAENRLGHSILVIQDCAHAFGTEFKKKLVANSGDAAIYGFSLSKMMTTMLGGILTTNDDLLYHQILQIRNDRFIKLPPLHRKARVILYLLASGLFFNESTFGLINTIEKVINQSSDQKNSNISNSISHPAAFFDTMYSTAAKIGLVQLKKYEQILQKRRYIAAFYRHHLAELCEQYGFTLPPDIDGSSYSYFVVKTPDRENIRKAAQKYQVQFGNPLDYYLPDLPTYREYASGHLFENALKCSRQTLNLPNYPGLSQHQQEQVISAFINALKYHK